VPLGDVERRLGLEEDATDPQTGDTVPSNGEALRLALKQDWALIMKAQGATHRALGRLLRCVWNQADPCQHTDGKMRKTTVNFGKWGCDWKGTLDLMVGCNKGKTKEDVLFPGNSTLAHEYEWSMIANGASVCVAGTDKTGTPRYINLFGFYGNRGQHRCSRTDPAALLMVLGVTPSNETKVGMTLNDLPKELVEELKSRGEL